MGRIVIEIPQHGTHFYRVQNEETIKELLKSLERIKQKEREEEDEDILGLWTTPEPITRAAKQ